jgi:hypothetical protein
MRQIIAATALFLFIGSATVFSLGNDTAPSQNGVVSLSYSGETHSASGSINTESGATIVTLPAKSSDHTVVAISFATSREGARLSQYVVTGSAENGMKAVAHVSGATAAGRSYGIVTLICDFDMASTDLKRIEVTQVSNQ